LISSHGWQTAFLVIGAVYLVLGLTIAFLTRDPPGKRAYLASLHENKETTGSWSLGEGRYTVIWMSVAVVFCCFCMAVAIVHVVPMLSDRGHSPEVAAGALAALMLAGAFGRMGAGKISDLIGPLQTYIATSAGQTILVVWLPHVETVFGIYLLAALFGFVFSGVMTSMVVTVNTFVPDQVAARCWSVVAFFAWAGMGLGSYVGGALFDLTGGYDWSFTFAGVMGAINVVILLSFHISRGRREPVHAAA
jgi:MFS family permease